MVESVPTVPGEIGRFSTAIGTEPAIARRIASERYPAGSEDKHKRGTCPDRVLPPRRSPRKDAAHNGRECLARSSRLPGGCADGGRRGRGGGRHPARGTPVRGGPTGTATRGRLRSRVEEQVARRGPVRRHLGRQAEVGENLPDDDRVLDGRDHSHPPATARTGEHIDGEGC